MQSPTDKDELLDVAEVNATEVTAERIEESNQVHQAFAEKQSEKSSEKSPEKSSEKPLFEWEEAPKMMRNIVNTLNGTLVDAVFSVYPAVNDEEACVKAHAVDAAKVALVNMGYKPRGLTVYTDEVVRFKIPVGVLAKLLEPKVFGLGNDASLTVSQFKGAKHIVITACKDNIIRRRFIDTLAEDSNDDYTLEVVFNKSIYLPLDILRSETTAACTTAEDPLMTFVIKKDSASNSLYVGIRSEKQSNDVWIELETQEVVVQGPQNVDSTSSLVFKQGTSTRKSMKTMDFDSMTTVFKTWSYAAAYLAHFVKKAEANGDVCINLVEMSDDPDDEQRPMPLEVMYGFGELCYFSFFLSPHIAEPAM